MFFKLRFKVNDFPDFELKGGFTRNEVFSTD